MSPLRTFNGVSFEEFQLRVLEPTFNESYAKSIKKNCDRIFVTVYKSDGTKIVRNFSEFDQDVERVCRVLLNKYRDVEVLATKAGNTYQHLVFIAAILKSGFQICPLNPNDPPEITAKKLNQLSENCKLLENLTIPDSSYASEKPKPRQGNSAFVLVFTSGSTGYSKIVQQTELGVLSNVEGLIRHHSLENSKFTLATPLPVFHVNALEFSFFVSLLSGQHLILFERFDLFQVLRCFSENRIHIFSAVPHLYHLLGQQIHKLVSMDLTDFRYFVSAAGPLPLATFELFAQKGLKILQGYGLSEAVNFSLKTPTRFSVEKIKSLASRFGRPPVGIPIWGNEVFVLDEQANPCGPEVPGEICIRGVNVMLGYRDRSGREIFRDEYLHTGDTGFWTHDEETGEKIFFVTGRLKDIAKKYGSTVSLVEVDDNVVRLLPSGMDAISVNFENLRAGEEIGLVLKDPLPSFDVDDFYQQLNKILTSEMMPSVIALTADSVRTESGKPIRWRFKDRLKEFLDSQSQARKYFVYDLRKSSNE